MTATGRLDAVCVVAALHPISTAVGDTAIDKRAVRGPVRLTSTAVDGDTCIDTRFHGGADQAVYAYSTEEADRWSRELGRPIEPGWFGENLRTSGIAVTDAVIGSLWEIGDAVLEVSIPRVPCGTFAKWVKEPRWVSRFTARADVGTYLRVLQEGAVEAGDEVRVSRVPAHGVTVRDLFVGTDRAKLETLLAQSDLAVKVYRDARAALDRLDRPARR